ncbi:MAG TPA: hypothetical protein DDY13_07245 [Cytophagales bacterium]|jgi:coenzyme F420-reducing hydrogenase delta subunit|nr:hypothetical protein [Cytophagales bacterium]
MEYFESKIYSDTVNQHRMAASKLTEALRIYSSLGTGENDEEIISDMLSSNRDELLTKRILEPMNKQLDESGIKVQKLRESMLAAAKEDAKEALEVINTTLRDLYNIDSYAFDIKNGNVIVSEDWKAELKAECTITPESEDQKRFAQLVDQFQETIQELKAILPRHIPVFKKDRIDEGVFFLDSVFDIEIIDTKALKSL